ncbi:hypothetical protein VB776_08410 [Arcicella sp. DC2W]|uniref:Outer membrane protein beta-barrel domain-containing protein n=1 Tax=Arcicella gelida TaxID=2984195 RepID=A0ABU5S3Y6_9BACT|nr:hypothetical protein [Arcicella sp. DC2W]MEA5402933.1 hypothetical protein [Arcicella sp. DC2W]
MKINFTLIRLYQKNIFSCIVLLFGGVIITPTHAQDFSNIRGQKPVTLNGSFESRGTFYNANGIANRRQPFSYLFNVAATLNIYGLSIPFSGTYSEADRSFRQPFNQFGISPTYKWITLHGGYRNIDYSPYTLGGHTMLGGGIELHPGKLRLGFMYGKLNRATTIDTTTQALVPYSFSRTAYAGKIGYGTDRTFFEFSYLQAKDDSTTISRNSVKADQYIAPASNNVLGYNTRITFLKRFTLETRGAVSIYTRDMNSPITISEKEKIIKELKKYMEVNGTTEFYTALDASLTYRARNYGLKVDYKRIDPEYKTMGAYFFNSDLEAWTFGPSLSIFKNRLRLSGSVGFQHDNLLDQKRSTNKRVIGSGSLSLDISKALAVDMNYSNFSNNQTPNTLRLYPDSLRIVQATQNATIAPRYTIMKTNTMQIVSVSASQNKLSDYNQVITSGKSSNSTIDTKQYFINYSINFLKKGIGAFVNVNRTELTSIILNNTYQGFTAGFYGTFLKKLQVNLNNSVTQGITQQGKSLVLNSTAIVSYNITKKQQFRTSLFYTSNKPSVESKQTSFNEFRNEISYVVNFR